MWSLLSTLNYGNFVTPKPQNRHSLLRLVDTASPCGLNVPLLDGESMDQPRGRKMIKALTTLTAVTLGFMMTASAKAQEPMWTGCHLGVGIGMGAVSTDVSSKYIGVNGLGDQGAIWGGMVGCDYEMPDTPLIIGVFADYTWLDMNSTVTPGIGSLSYDGQYTVGGRIGTLLTPRTFGYLLVGYSEMDSSAKILGKNLALSDFSGYAVGGGLETDLGSNLRLGLEGRWYEYDSQSAKIYGKRIDFDPDVQTVKLNLKWQFWSGTALQPIPLK